MNSNLLLGAITVPILTMGVGCTVQNIDNQIHSNYDSSYTTYATSTEVSSSGTLPISFVIEPGVQVVQIDSGPPLITTENYGTALSLYEKSGMRFGFTNCSSNLKSLITRPDINFMIDNRDNKSHTIGIGDNTYTFAPYDFAIVKIKKVGNFTITCDDNEVAYIQTKK